MLEVNTNSMGFLQVTFTDSSTERHSLVMLHGLSSSSIFPLSILERSSTSFISFSSACEFSLMMSLKCAFSLASSSSLLLASSPENPTMAFSGVLISWLMFARKADFILLDSSALSLAISSSLLLFINSSFMLLSFTK